GPAGAGLPVQLWLAWWRRQYSALRSTAPSRRCEDLSWRRSRQNSRARSNWTRSAFHCLGGSRFREPGCESLAKRTLIATSRDFNPSSTLPSSGSIWEYGIFFTLPYMLRQFPPRD